MSMFFWQILYILNFENNYTMLHFSAYHEQCLLFTERFVCNLHAYSAIFSIFAVHGRHGTVENASRNLEFEGFQD